MKNVTVANYVRAESDHMIRANMRAFGMGIGKVVHQREPGTLFVADLQLVQGDASILSSGD